MGGDECHLCLEAIIPIGSDGHYEWVHAAELDHRPKAFAHKVVTTNPLPGVDLTVTPEEEAAAIQSILTAHGEVNR